MTKKKQTECKTTKYFPRDFRGRFIKKKATTKENLAATREIIIPENRPVTLYAQLYCPETDFDYVLDNNVISTLRAPRELSLDPHVKTYKVAVSGTLSFCTFAEDCGLVHPKDDVYYQSYSKAPLAYSEVVKLRQASSNPLRLSDYAESNEGIDNIGTGNVGIQNSGYYNKGIRISGCFNVGNSGIFMFNKPCLEYKSYLDVPLPPFLGCPLDNLDDFDKPLRHMTALESFNKAKLKEDWPEQYKMLISLPNFDYGIFALITGISKKMLDEANKEWKKKFGKKHRRKK